MKKKCYLSADEYVFDCDCVEQFGDCNCERQPPKTSKKERKRYGTSYLQRQPCMTNACQPQFPEQTTTQNTTPLADSPGNPTYQTHKPCDNTTVCGDQHAEVDPSNTKKSCIRSSYSKQNSPQHSPQSSMYQTFKPRGGAAIRTDLVAEIDPEAKTCKSPYLKQAANTLPLYSPKNSIYDSHKCHDNTLIHGEKCGQRCTLKGQFPCPCISLDMMDQTKDNLWDLQFYRWWGWNWLKKRENILRDQMEKEGKQFSEEFPIVMANYFTTETKRQWLDAQQKIQQQQQPAQEPQERSCIRFHDVPEKRSFVTEEPQVKHEKRWSLFKSFNNAVKAFKAGDKSGVGVSCQCGTDLNICGPYNKTSDGRERIIMPCGMECNCGSGRECLNPYLRTTCPCQICHNKCSKDHTPNPLGVLGQPPSPPPERRKVCASSTESLEIMSCSMHDHGPAPPVPSPPPCPPQCWYQGKIYEHPVQEQVPPEMKEGTCGLCNRRLEDIPLYGRKNVPVKRDVHGDITGEELNVSHVPPEKSRQVDAYQRDISDNDMEKTRCGAALLEKILFLGKKKFGLQRGAHTEIEEEEDDDEEEGEEEDLHHSGKGAFESTHPHGGRKASVSRVAPTKITEHELNHAGESPQHISFRNGKQAEIARKQPNHFTRNPEDTSSYGRRQTRTHRDVPTEIIEEELDGEVVPFCCGKRVPIEMVEEELSRDDRCFSSSQHQFCGGRKVQATAKVESVEVLSIKMQKITSDDEYCCSCDDEDSCECRCCLNLTNEMIQTSQFCLRESFTQTDRTRQPKKCCRCCRCCSNKNRCLKCTKKSNGDQKRICAVGMNTVPTQQPQTIPESSSKQTSNFNQRSSESGRKSIELPSKTLMVRTNSVQCLPAQESKGTNCSCEERFEPHHLDHFVSQFCQPNYEKIGKGLFPNAGADFGKLSINASDINAITGAKLRNFLLEGDVYSSPVTGRNYDLSYRAVETKPRMTSTKLLKPLSAEDELKYLNLSSHCFSADVEHTKLMTAVCEAILSAPSATPTKDKSYESKGRSEDASKSQPVVVLHTIKEDNESANSEISAGAFDNMLNAAYKSIYKDEMDSANADRIFEMQENFKSKIEKLEEKMEKLMSDTSNTATIQQEMLSMQNTVSNQAKTPVQDSRKLLPIIEERTSPHEQPDDQKRADDPIDTYETLVMANKKRVDDLLIQLESLNSSNSLAKQSEFCKSFCFENEELTYKPDLSEGLAPPLDDNANSTDSCKDMLDQLDKFFSGGKQSSCADDLAIASTSFDRDSGVVKDESLESDRHRNYLDFSSIVFSPSDKTTARNSFAPQNFIVQNLPSFNTTISDNYTIEKILRGYKPDNVAVGSSDSPVCSQDLPAQKSSLSIVELKNKL